MKIWIIILLLLMFGIFEMFASFSFNIKIKMINKKKHTYAAALGAFSTTLFMTMAMLAPIIAAETTIWFIIAGSFMMAIGNVAAMLLMIPFDSWWNKRKEKNEKEENL